MLYCISIFASINACSFERSCIMSISDDESRWLSMTEICKHLGISRDTAIKWINKKNLPSHKIGRLWKFKIIEVDEWVRSGGAEEKEGES